MLSIKERPSQGELETEEDDELGSVADSRDRNVDRDSMTLSVLQVHISSIQYTAKDFFSTVHSNMLKGVNMVNLRGTNGFSLLHQVVNRDRVDLVSVFYDVGLLSEMVKLIVKNMHSQYHDITPLALAEKEKKKCRYEIESYMQKDKALTKACRFARSGNVDKLKSLIEKNPNDVYQMSEADGTYPIFWACVANSKPCIDFLIENGANLDVRNKDGEKILTKICSLGHVDLVKYLLEKYKLDPNQRGLHDKTSLERIAETGDFSLFKVLIDSGAFLDNCVLHSAARGGQVSFIQKLMEAHRAEFDVNGRDAAQRTPLLHAADNAHVPALKTLIAYGADITVQDKRGRNVLHYLADANSTQGCEIVLDQAERFNVIQRIINERELYLGAEQCFLIRGRDKGQYAWHYVIVDRGLLVVFKMVISGGQVDVGKYGNIIKSGWGVSPSQEIVDEVGKRYDLTILRSGIQPDMAPLHYSIIRENDALSLKLIQSGADVHQKDSFGLTPMHLAAMKGQLFIVKQLEANGASVDVLDDKQRRPHDLAEANRQSRVSNYLKSALNISKCKNFLERDLPNSQSRLQLQELERMKSEGVDVTQHLIQQLRELEIKIEYALFDIGTSPIMQPVSLDDRSAQIYREADVAPAVQWNRT